jgi:hypothetical protein
MQVLISDELCSLLTASPAFSKKYDTTYELVIRMGAGTGIVKNDIHGPGVYRKHKNVEFAVNLTFDVILRAEDGPRRALRFLFDGIRTVLARYEIDTTKLDANEERIIEAICSDPEMFHYGWENKPWPTLANQKPPPPPAPEDPTLPAFKRLYKRIDGVLHYEAVGAHDGMALYHYGKVGSKGKSKELPYNREAPKKAVETFLGVAVAKGFTELPEDHEIEIQYAIDGFGSEEDLEPLHALEEHLHNLLGELGLGVCNENSIGGDTMEVSCFVVDADIAMKCIKKSLKGTRFADYVTMHVVERDEEDDEE